MMTKPFLTRPGRGTVRTWQTSAQAQACLDKAAVYTYSITRVGDNRAEVTLLFGSDVWDKVAVEKDSSGQWQPAD